MTPCCALVCVFMLLLSLVPGARSFRTAYLNKRSTLVWQQRKIACNYLKGR